MLFLTHSLDTPPKEEDNYRKFDKLEDSGAQEEILVDFHESELGNVARYDTGMEENEIVLRDETEGALLTGFCDD